MIAELNKYGALCAKVHGMYGKRLRPEDYAQLLAMHSTEEILSFLRSRQDWSRALRYLRDGVPVTRARLETALRLQYLDDYVSLFAFVGRQDRALMRFPVYKIELAEILSALRRLHSRSPLEALPEVPEFYRAHSKVDFAALRQAQSLEQMAQAISGSIFQAPLERFARSGQGGSQYVAMEALLRAAYYTKLYSHVQAYRGEAHSLMKKSLDQETELLSIIHFLRLKRYFGPEDIRAYAFPLPLGRRGQQLVQALLDAPDYPGALAVLRQSRYGKLFRGEEARPEVYFEQLSYRFNRAQLRRAVPSIYTAVAYLTLKELELNNLISILECTRYGVDPRRTELHLVGVY